VLKSADSTSVPWLNRPILLRTLWLEKVPQSETFDCGDPRDISTRIAKIRVGPVLLVRRDEAVEARPFGSANLCSDSADRIWPANKTDDATPGTVPCCPQDHTPTMHTTVNDVHTVDELRQFIHQTLCEKENLLADQFTMSQLQLTRRNERCGLQFCLRGPRNVRLAAIWVADQNVVYLYDARGTRYAKLRLKNGLALQEQARAA
jgi:hypothetical protein